MTTSKFIDLYKADNQLLSPDPMLVTELALKMEKESVKIEKENHAQNLLNIFKSRYIASKFAVTAVAICLIIAGTVFLPVIYNSRSLTENKKEDKINTLQQTLEADVEDNIIYDDNYYDNDNHNNTDVEKGIAIDENANDSSIVSFSVTEGDGIAIEETPVDDSVEYFTGDAISNLEQSSNNEDSVLTESIFDGNNNINNFIGGENSDEYESEENLIEPKTFGIKSFEEFSTEDDIIDETFSDDSISAEPSLEEVISIEESLEDSPAEEIPFSIFSFDESSSDDAGFVLPNRSFGDYEEGYGENNTNSGRSQSVYNSVSGFSNWPEEDFWNNLDISDELPEHSLNKESSETTSDSCNDIVVESNTPEVESKPLIPLDYNYFKDFAESFLSGTHAAVGVEYNSGSGLVKKDLLGKDTTPFYALLSSCLEEELLINNTSSKDYVLYTVRTNGREVNFRITSDNRMEITLSDYSGSYFIKLNGDTYNKVWNLAESY